MAEFTLATEKLRQSGLTGGLQSGGISKGVTLATGRIDPNAASVGYTPTEAPGIVPDEFAPGMQHFLGAMSEAAFKYQERESTFMSNELVLGVNAQINDILHGTDDGQGNVTPGYLSSSMDSARTAYPGYEQAIDDIVFNSLQNVEPRVAEKATFAVMRAKNAANLQAANHRSSQLSKAETAQKEARVMQMTALMVDNPDLADYVDPSTGASMKSDYMKLLGESDGIAAYQTSLVEVNKNIYLKSAANGNYALGYGEALKFFKTNEKELRSNPKLLNKAQTNLEVSRRDMVKAQVDLNTLNETKEEEDMDLRRSKNSAELYERVNNSQFPVDWRPSLQELTQLRSDPAQDVKSVDYAIEVWYGNAADRLGSIDLNRVNSMKERSRLYAANDWMFEGRDMRGWTQDQSINMGATPAEIKVVQEYQATLDRGRAAIDEENIRLLRRYIAPAGRERTDNPENFKNRNNVIEAEYMKLRSRGMRAEEAMYLAVVPEGGSSMYYTYEKNFLNSLPNKLADRSKAPDTIVAARLMMSDVYSKLQSNEDPIVEERLYKTLRQLVFRSTVLITNEERRLRYEGGSERTVK